MKTKVEWSIYEKDDHFPGILRDGPFTERQATAVFHKFYQAKGRRQHHRIVKTTHEEVEG